MRQTLDFLLAGAEVNRFHTYKTLQNETVGHHSHGVACLALLMDPSASQALLVAALFHDLSEHQTGDIPSPAKRQYGIGEQVEKLELQLMLEAGVNFPELTPRDARTLKLADIAHGALFCLREINLGNRRMRVVYDTYISYAHKFRLVGLEKDLFNLIEEMSRECE